jgi:hypothetical protein
MYLLKHLDQLACVGNYIFDSESAWVEHNAKYYELKTKPYSMVSVAMIDLDTEEIIEINSYVETSKFTYRWINPNFLNRLLMAYEFRDYKHEWNAYFWVNANLQSIYLNVGSFEEIVEITKQLNQGIQPKYIERLTFDQFKLHYLPFGILNAPIAIERG